MADISEELARRGHRVDVATTRATKVQTWGTVLPRFERLDGVGVYRFRSLSRGRLGWHALRFGNQRRLAGAPSWLTEPFIVFGNGPWAPGLAWHLLREAADYDLIHLQTLPYAHVIYGAISARVAGRPLVITPHIHVEQPEVFDLEAFGRTLRAADMVVAVSEREIPYLIDRGIRPERILLGGNGVKLDELPRLDSAACRQRLGLPSDAFVLLFLGRKERYKGLGTLVESFCRLHAQYPNLYLVSAGPSTEFSRELVREHADLTRWIDLNTVDAAQKLDLLNACDVLLLPSTGEAFGIVFLEAWAVGKPVIGARAGAIPWVIREERDGLLVSPGDVTETAAAIERLIGNPEMGRSLGANGYAKVQAQYTVEHIADRVEAGYREVLARAGARAHRTRGS